MSNIRYNSILIVGVGLIGSSLARAIREKNLAKNIYGLDNDVNNLKKCNELQILSKGSIMLDDYSEQFDMIIEFTISHCCNLQSLPIVVFGPIVEC